MRAMSTTDNDTRSDAGGGKRRDDFQPNAAAAASLIKIHGNDAPVAVLGST